MKTKPLIEKYFTYQRLAEEQGRMRIKEQALRMTRQQRDFNLMLLSSYKTTYTQMAEKSQKYRLATSAQAMVEALRPRPLLREDLSFSTIEAIAKHTRTLDPDIQTPVLHLPDKPIWIELEAPIPTTTGEIAGMFFTCADREVEEQLTQPQTPAMRRVLEGAGREPGQEYMWSLHFIHADGTPTSHYQYHEAGRTWSIIPDVEPCPTDECKIIKKRSKLTGKVTKSIIPCPFCATVLAQWRSWFVTALLTIQGEFAATEEIEWPIRKELTTRKVQRPNSYKYDEVSITHDYYFVSFDASVRKRHVPPADEAAPTEQEGTPRGSWLATALEIDPESVVYVKHDFGTTSRSLDPDRNPRWKQKQIVAVKAHVRRVPIKVSNLQHRIIHVIASAYEQKTTDEEQ